jgi:hypothetical protein
MAEKETNTGNDTDYTYGLAAYLPENRLEGGEFVHIPSLEVIMGRGKCTPDAKMTEEQERSILGVK